MEEGVSRYQGGWDPSRAAFTASELFPDARRLTRGAVVLAKSELVDKLGVVCFPSNPLRAPIVRPFDRSLRFFSESCSVAARDPRASPSTGRSAAVREATEADRFGPAPLGMVVFHLAGLAVSGNPGQTRDSYRLAPAGIPPLLEVEIPLWPSRSSQRSGRNTPADSPDEPLWRNVESGDGRVPGRGTRTAPESQWSAP